MFVGAMDYYILTSVTPKQMD